MCAYASALRDSATLLLMLRYAPRERYAERVDDIHAYERDMAMLRRYKMRSALSTISPQQLTYEEYASIRQQYSRAVMSLAYTPAFYSAPP